MHDEYSFDVDYDVVRFSA